MDQQFQRLEPAVGAHEAEKWTPWARGKLQEHRLLTRTNTVIIRSETQGLVRQLDDDVYVVNLEAKACSCLVFQENGNPCGHAITTIFAIPGRDLTLYMPEKLSIDTWKMTYRLNFPLIDISGLSKAPFTDSHPPLTQVPRGRPKKERLRKGKTRGPKREAAAQAMAEPAGDSDDEVWSLYYCFTYEGRGHFSSICKRPHK